MEASVGEQEGPQGRGQRGRRVLWRDKEAPQQEGHLQVEAAVANRHPGVAKKRLFRHRHSSDCSIDTPSIDHCCALWTATSSVVLLYTG